jgi:hypothetical protein
MSDKAIRSCILLNIYLYLSSLIYDSFEGPLRDILMLFDVSLLHCRLIEVDLLPSILA